MEQRLGVMLLFVFIFLGSFVILINFIPSEMVTATQTTPKNYESYETSNKVWHGKDISMYSSNISYMITIDFNEIFWVGGRRFSLIADYDIFPYREGIRMTYQYGFLNLWSDTGKWYSHNGTQIDHDYWTFFGFASEIYGKDLNDVYDEFGDIKITIKYDIEAKFQVDLIFDFNTTVYETPKEAWINDDLNLLIGITLDNENTSLSAWDITAKLLTFQTLQVFGDSGILALVMNGIIALPIWVSIIYISFVIAMEVLDRLIPL